MADQGIDIDEEDETDEFDENFYKMSSVTDEVCVILFVTCVVLSNGFSGVNI